jgi:glycosyltransferase involved in cell wall biosynthesis
MHHAYVGTDIFAAVMGLGRRQRRRAEGDALRVMYVQPAEVLGGAERQGVLHVSGLRRLGLEVVAVVGPSPLIRGALEARGVRDYVFLEEFFCEEERPISPRQRVGFELRRARTWIRMQGQLTRIARQRGVDVIVANRSVGWLVASPVAHRLGLPLVWRGGGRPTSTLQSLVLRLFARRWAPDLLLGNCEAVRADIARLVSCPSRVLPNGVDTKRFDAARVAPRFRPELGLAPETPVVGLAARPAPEKNLELLAAALLRVARRVPDVRLLVAGEFGWRAHYQALYSRLGLAERTIFLGHVDDIEALYASSDVVVLTSHERSIEGAPNAILEAMAMSRPVVATRVGGVPELVEHGAEGLLSPPGEVAALAGNLIRLLEDRELRVGMGARGRATVERRFGEPAVTTALADALEEVVAERRARTVGR